MTDNSDDSPGELIGAGRAADVYDIGDGRVLRRNRDGSSTEREAAIMRFLTTQNFPVPEICDASGGDLVMERIDGPTMLESFGRTPWKMRSWAKMLASLHATLEAISLPDLDLPDRFQPGEALVHGDLHPDNIMLTSAGPVVIDWPNIGTGPRGVEVANTWSIIATSDIDATSIAGKVQSAGRSFFLRTFLRHAGRERARLLLPIAAEHQLKDPNLRPTETANIHKLLEAEGQA